MWKALLIFTTFLSITAIAQSPSAAFSFVEDLTKGGNIATVQAGERKVVDLVTANGTTQFEIGLIRVPRTTPGVIEHWQVFGRNLGGFGQLNYPDHAVHPTGVIVRFQNTGVSTATNQIFDRNNRYLAHVHVNSQNRVYGLRDGWLQEPTRLQTGPADGGTILFYCLDGRESPNGFPHYYGHYQTSFNGTPGEDPLSATNHRWKGGFMKLWDIIVTDNISWNWIEFDPMPTSTPNDWYYKIRHVHSSNRVQYPPRIQKVMESLDKINVTQQGIPKDPIGAHTLMWWIFQAENRFRYWGDGNDFYLNVGPNAHQVGWKDWLCLKWQEGHYNNGYNWASIMFRRWLDTRSQVAWWIFTRIAKWEGTSGLVWTGVWNHTNQSFAPDVRHGSDWYEKGTRGWEIGSNYWPSNYKNYSEQVLLADLVYNQWWTIEAVASHARYIRHGAKYANWNGAYGSRIAGWGIMNAMSFYRFTKDLQWLNYARSIADNAISIMKQPVRMQHEESMHGQRWVSNTLGVPYIYNNGANGRREFSSWGTAKLITGMVEIAVYGPTSDYNAKIQQMSEFLVLECMVDFGDVILHRPQMSSDRIIAQYYNGHLGGRINWLSNTTTGDWFIWPIGYSATILNSKICRAVFPRLVSQMGELLDWAVPMNHQKYEIGTGDLIGDLVTTNGINLEGVTKYHNLRLQSKIDGSYALFHIVHMNGNVIEVQQFWSSNNTTFVNEDYVVTIVGPMGEDRSNPGYFVRTTVDRAIRTIAVNTSNRPDPNRPFDWSNGRHFNNWQKMVAIPLTQAGIIYHGLKIFLRKQQKAGLESISTQK